MAGTANARGGLGWVILVIALAVPGVLFFNWWSHLKADREKAVAAKARGRVPEGGVFQSSPNAKLVNPMVPAVSTGAPAAAAASTAPVHAAAAPVAAAPKPAPASPASASAATLAAPVEASTAAPVSAPPSFTVSTSAVIPLKRDPTLSPFDLVRILEQEEAKRKAAEDLENAKRMRVSGGKRKAKAVDPASQINLQGIVSNPDSGFKAIVNDEVLGVGEFIGKTGIKIVKITDLGVTFVYQGKRFSKGVSRD